jgi:hypothetical protein
VNSSLRTKEARSSKKWKASPRLYGSITQKWITYDEVFQRAKEGLLLKLFKKQMPLMDRAYN